MIEPATPLPWKVINDPAGPGRPQSFNVLVAGNYSAHEEDPDGDESIFSGSCTSVAHVLGNATSGNIQRRNAEFLVVAANHFHGLVKSVRALLSGVEEFANPSEASLAGIARIRANLDVIENGPR